MLKCLKTPKNLQIHMINTIGKVVTIIFTYRSNLSIFCLYNKCHVEIEPNFYKCFVKNVILFFTSPESSYSFRDNMRSKNQGINVSVELAFSIFLFLF